MRSGQALADQVTIACHECDLLQREVVVNDGGIARCTRCGCFLYRRRDRSIERTLALTVAALVLLIIANVQPFLAFNMAGLSVETTLGTGIGALYVQGKPLVAGVVLVTAVIAPAFHVLAFLYLLAPLHLGRTPPGLARVFRAVRHVKTWSMIEVFMLGTLVSVAKLMGMAEIVPGPALWALMGLIFTLAAVGSSLDPRVVWDRLEVAA